MIAYKAFANTDLVAGGKRFAMGQTSRTEKACVLRVSGLHACTSIEAARKYYPDQPVLVVCEVLESDIVDSHNGVLVARALTPREFVSSSIPADQSVFGEDDEEDRSPSEIAAAQLRNIADQIESGDF